MNPRQYLGWEPELLAPTKDFEKGQLNTQVQAKVELPGSKIPSFFKMLKKIGYAQKNIICTALKVLQKSISCFSPLVDVELISSLLLPLY